MGLVRHYLCATQVLEMISGKILCAAISAIFTQATQHIQRQMRRRERTVKQRKTREPSCKKGGCSCAQGPVYAAGQSGFNSQPFHKSSAKVGITHFFSWCSLYCIWEHMWCSPLFPSTGNAGALSAMLTGQFDRSLWDEYTAPDDKCTSSLITSSELFEGALSRAFGYNHFLWVL